MKYTQLFLVHLCALLIFTACSKEEQSSLNIDASGKVNKYEGDFKAKDFRLKWIKYKITYPPYLSKTPFEEHFEIRYTNWGEIEKINVTTKNGDILWEYYYLVHFNGARMDSISVNSISGSGPLFSSIKYHGNDIVEVLFHYSPLMAEKKIFEYDNKGRLLNGLNGLRFIYDENGLLAKIVSPIEFFSSFFSYEKTLNPLYIRNLHLFFPYRSISELCHSPWNIITVKKGQEIVTHKNNYDEMGRLRTKTYSEGDTDYQFEFSYY